jgi:hypothetical protein
MKTNSNKLYGVPSEAKKANYFVRVISKRADGTLICDGYKPTEKPKNPVDSFELRNEAGEWTMKEFMVCAGMQAAYTPLNALLHMDEEKRLATLNELAEDGAVMF